MNLIAYNNSLSIPLKSEFPRLKRLKEIPPKTRQYKVDLVGKVIWSKFLGPQFWTWRDFTNYIEWPYTEFITNLRKGHILHPELVIRISEATGTDPMYWIEKLIEQDESNLKRALNHITSFNRHLSWLD